MTLQHSKTWPVNSSTAVVHLKVGRDGRAYSTFLGQDFPTVLNNLGGDTANFSGHQEGGGNATAREGQIDFDEKTVQIQPPLEGFQVLALAKIGRKDQNLLDSNNPIRFPQSQNATDTIQCTCKSKIPSKTHPNNEHTSDCLLPEIPLDARKVTTLRRHYYPEGGWGWVIVACSVLVHVLNNGLQLSCSQLVLPAAEKFKIFPVHVAGESEKNCLLTSRIYAQKYPDKKHSDERSFRNLLNRFIEMCEIQKTKKKLGRTEDNQLSVLLVATEHTGTIMSNNQATIKALGSHEISSKMVWKCLKKLNELGKRNKVTLLWVPGHTGVEGNEGSGADEQHVSSRADRLVADLRQLLTLKQHYYPEGGWGWVILIVGVLVHVLSHGLLVSYGLFYLETVRKFGNPITQTAGWLGAVSTGMALLISPVTIAFCRRKSTRVTAVMGGLITALGCLFTSFATQFHQLFFSYGTVVGIGVGITRDCSTLMVAQYFKRRREFVEIFIVSGSGLGIAVMSIIIKTTIGTLGWRLGLQVVTGAVSITFILGTFYRSASLYHPQRRAILHIKNQKRKIKDKNKIEDKIPFFDFSTLKSKTVRILLISTGISAFGINTPLFYLAYQAEVEGLGDSTVFLQMYLGLAWTLGCVVFSTLVLHNSTECRIARQYLCQTAVFMCGLSILAFTVVSGNYHAYVMFAWIYGIFCGGYHYSLKMYTYERVRARNFARTWGFVQCSQAIPIVIGVPFSGYMNEKCGDRAGYYFSSTCVLVGSLTLFLIDLHRRNISRHKHTRENGTRHLCVSETCPQRRKLSFSQEPEHEPGVTAGAAAAALVLGTDLMPNQPPGFIENILCSNDKPELTCISEEGIADMDLPDNLLDDLDYIGDCITSCNKVENYLMLSEFENNLIAEMPVILDRRGRRWSLARPSKVNNQGSVEEASEGGNEEATNGVGKNAAAKWKVFPNRVITVIDESSV